MSDLKYNSIEKLTHRLYLNNYTLSRTSFYFEKELYKSRIANTEIDQVVFVTGLARAGTTVLFNALFQTNAYASLKYSNMPLLLMPNLWHKLHNVKVSPLQERIHGDGIMVNNDSPEAFDEYFWKVFLNDSYIKENHLSLHEVSDKILAEYVQFMKLVCFSQHKTNYLTKNNNNILRINSLQKLNLKKKILLVYRHPLEHAMSLQKEHKLFSDYQKKEPFSLEYFDFLGHYEFGLHHKPFSFNENDLSVLEDLGKDNTDYWLYCWKSYYKYILESISGDMILVAFDDLCNFPDRVTAYMKNQLNLNTLPVIPQRKKITTYEGTCNQALLSECVEIYNQLNEFKQY